MIRDGRFRWAAGIVLALLAGSLIVGWKHYADVEAQRAEISCRRADFDRLITSTE